MDLHAHMGDVSLFSISACMTYSFSYLASKLRTETVIEELTRKKNTNMPKIGPNMPFGSEKN